MVVTLGQQYHVGENPTVILYTCVNRHAGTPNKTKTKTRAWVTAQFVTFGSRVGWVSMKEISTNVDVERYILPYKFPFFLSFLPF